MVMLSWVFQSVQRGMSASRAEEYHRKTTGDISMEIQHKSLKATDKFREVDFHSNPRSDKNAGNTVLLWSKMTILRLAVCPSK
ncbi:hypothetical protein AVEN_100727-1 [Araneus ventricosus]|uniref:Uncharacterized protein n=1 Tax=Araneus ventricosus TaxID=182803 RepID=A0A4Y2CTT4_ARAVE|nr:hypothetical protein AVEN_100727-1 [Araneus ventricosus]